MSRPSAAVHFCTVFRRATSSHSLHADDYGPSQALGRRLRAAQSWGIRYPSVRHAGGECVGIFRPRALRHAKAAAHLALHWDGTRITHWYEKRQPHAVNE